MSGLVEYGSSDEEDETLAERPAKIAKTAHSGSELRAQPKVPQPNVPADTTPIVQLPLNQATQPLASAPAGPSLGPSAPLPEPPAAAQTPISVPSSPYTSSRQRLREQTMPTIPNFDIPTSPPPPAPSSEEAAALAATTKKFDRFLELKKQGVHFNQRLESTDSLRNPRLLEKLMEFAGISTEDSYASTLPAELAVPGVWPETCSPENLVKMNERQNRKRLGEREKVDFVAATKSGASSKTGTPKSGAEGRRSKFDRR